MNERKHIAQKLLLAFAVFVGLGVIYHYFQLEEDLKRQVPFRPAIEEALAAEVIYMGDCSDTYCAADERGSIGGYLQELWPTKKVAPLSSTGFHGNIFLQNMRILASKSKRPDSIQTVVVALNLRSFAPHIVHDYFYSPTINQQLMLLDPAYPSFVNRLRLTFNTEKSLVRQQMEEQARAAENQSLFTFLPASKQTTLPDWKERLPSNDTVRSYLNDLAFEINSDHVRLRDFDQIVQLAQAQGWDLWFHIVPLNFEMADVLVGKELELLVSRNLQFLKNRYGSAGVRFIDHTKLIEKEGFMHAQSNSHFFDAAKKTMAQEIVRQLKIEKSSR